MNNTIYKRTWLTKIEHSNQELHNAYFFSRVCRTVTKVTILYVIKKVSTNFTGLKSFDILIVSEHSKIKLEINNKTMRTVSNVCT